MTEYTRLSISKQLAEAGFKGDHEQGWFLDFPDKGENGLYDDVVYPEMPAKRVPAYSSDVLLSWLLSHGDSIEITPDIDGFNCTYWVEHEDYNGINIFLCDALAEVILAVMAKEAKHD